jgi:hypothetical protein
MGIKERMMDGMIDKMSAEQKQKAMEAMMEKFLGGLSSEERGKMMEGMMEKFLGGMSAEERNAMMSRMMPQMMGSMMGGEGMMGMMGRMMGGMMGGGMRSEAGRGPESAGKGAEAGRQGAEAEGAREMPWDMCRKMMGAMTEGTQTARFATPEVRGLFDEWAAQIEEELLQFTKDAGGVDVQKAAEHFRLSKESTIYFLTRLAQKGKIEFGKKNTE